MSEDIREEEYKSEGRETEVSAEKPEVISAETVMDNVTEAAALSNEDTPVDTAADTPSDMENRYDAQDEPEKGRSKSRYLAVFLAGFAACIAVISILTYGLGLGRIMTKGDWDYYNKLDDNYGKYAEIMRMIGEDPLSQTVPEEISDDVLREIVASTGDPYAQYFTAEEYDQFSKTYTGGYVGIGIGVEYSEGEVIVMTVYEDGPA